MRKARHAYSNAGGADVVIGIIKIRGLKLFRFMPALLFRCRAVTRSDSIPGNKFHALFRTRRNAPQSMEPILWKKSFLISRRVPIMHMHHPLTSSPLPLYIRSPAAPVPLSPPLPRVKAVFSAFKPNDSSNPNNKSGRGIYRYLSPVNVLHVLSV